MAMATWGGEHRSLVRQALATQSVLAMAVRQHGLSESPQAPSPLTWEEWAGTESARRTKLIIFSFFNLHTLAFNVPCPLLIADIQLRMPCPEMEWKSTDAISWRRIHQDTNESPLFQDCINALLSNNGVLPVFSSLGAHVLIHALLQRIITIQQAVKLVGPESQMTSELTLSLKQALKKWQNGWEQNPESSYSPLDQYGPIAFNSRVSQYPEELSLKMRALYHLAYIRLSIDIGSASSLLEKTPDEIAKNLHDSPRLQKSPHLLLAAKHAVCWLSPTSYHIISNFATDLLNHLKTAALCSPVQMGVHFVGRAPSWSVMHAVCSLEYAYALNRFLEAYVLSPGILQHDEQALIDTIKETLYEVETALPDGNLKIIETEPRALGPKAVRAWAMILQGMQTWNAVSLITKCLFAYADLLEQVSFQNTTRDL
ncbi:uncharacterized protein N7483_005799 [Penicillium malachiteum]|uniref:uncharacterized protein n=1 Tax=Penicillium malachiteum TaxID=1324776 RepID=UPI0025476543|nr:uncharacterized protein N7483_005799 [Penicillium malachiteum]KAJ5731291.1 hypothetical protein N7483_005799 [Penicillium malachiteum]